MAMFAWHGMSMSSWGGNPELEWSWSWARSRSRVHRMMMRPKLLLLLHITLRHTLNWEPDQNHNKGALAA